MVTKLDHIGIAVSNLDEALKLYTETLGLKLEGTEVVEEQKVKVAFLPLGDTEIELLESTEPDGPIAKFIESKGQGIQHIALKVENIEKALEELKEKGIRLIDEKTRRVYHTVVALPRILQESVEDDCILRQVTDLCIQLRCKENP